MPPIDQPTKTIELKMVGRPVTVDQLKDKLKRIDDASKKAIFDTLDRLYEKNSETKVLESLEQFAAALAGSDVIENTRAASSDGVDLDFLLGINSFDIRALFQICKVDPSSPTSEDEFKAKLAEFLEIPNYGVTTPLPAASAGETPESEASLEVKSVEDRVEALQERLGQKPDPKFIRLQQGVIRAISENFQEGKFIVQGLATELEMEMILEVLSSRFPEKFKTFGFLRDSFGYRLFCGQEGVPEDYTQILPISRELERLSEVAESRSGVDAAYANMLENQWGNKSAGGSRAWSIARFAAGYVKNLTIGFIPVVGYALSSYASLRAKMEEVGIYKGMIPTDSSFEWQAAVTRRRGVDGVFTLVCHDLSGDESDLKGYAFWARQYELMSRGFSYNQAVIVSVEQILPKVNSFPVAKALMALISDPQTYTDIQGSWALKGISLPDLSEIFDEANPRLLQPAGIEKLIIAIHSLCLNIDQSQSLGLHRLLGVDVVSALSKVAQPTELDQSYLLKIQSRGSILGIIGIDGSKRLNKNTSLQAVLGGVSAVMGLTSTFAQAFKGSEYLLSGALEAMTRPAGTLANTWRRVVIARETRQMKHDAVTADSILGEILSTASMMSLGVVSYAIGTQLAGHQLADLMRNGGAANGLDKFLSGTGIKFFVRAAMALSVGAFGAAREVRRGGSYQSSMEAAIRYGMGTWAGSSLYSAYDALGAFATNNGQMSMWQIAHDTLEDMKKAASGVPDISSKLPEVPQDVDGINTPVSQIRYNKAGYTDTFSAAGFDEESAFANADESAGGRLNLPLQEQPDLQEQRSYQTGAASGYILDEQGQTRSWEEISRSLKPGITVSFIDGNGDSVSHVVQQGETLEQVLGTSDPEKLESFVRYNPGAFAATDELDVITEVPVEDIGTTVLGSVASPDKTFQSTGSSLPNQETPPQAPPVAQPLDQQPAPQGAPVQPQVPYNFPSSSVDTANWKDDNAAALAVRANMVASLAVAAGGQSNPAGLRSDILAGLSQEELAKIAGLTQQQIEAAGSVEGALKELGLSSSEAYQVSVIFTEGATVEKILRNSPTLVAVAPGSQALPQTIPNQPTVVTQPQATQTAPITVGPFASDNIPAETPISANQQQTLQVDPTYSGHLSALDQWVNEAGNGSGGQERSSIAAYVRAILAVLDADGNGTIVDDQTLNNFRRVFDINGMIKQSDIVEIATALYIANDLDPKLNNLNISSFTSNPEAFKDLLINAHTSRPDLLALYVDDFVSKYKGAEEGIVTGMEIQNGQTPQGWAGSTEGGFSGNTSPFPPGSEILNIQSVVITEVLRNDELNTPLRLNGPTDLNASITYNRIPGQNAYSVIVPPDSRFLTFGRAFQGLPFAAQAWGYRAFEGNFETVTYLYVKPDDSSLGYIFDQNRQLIGIYNSEDGKTYWSSAGITNEMELDLGGGRFVKMSVITSSTSEEIKAILSGQNPSTPVATETTDTSIPEPDANPQFGGTPNQQPSPISIPETAPGPTPPESGTPEFTAEATAGASIINLFERGRTDVVHISPSEYQSISGADWQTILEGISPDKDILFIGSNLQVYSTNVGENTIPHLNVSGDNLATLNEVMHSGPIGASSTPVSVSLDAELSTSAEAYEAILDYSYNGGNGVREVILTINGSEKGDMVAFRISNNGNEVTVSELGNSQAIYKIADLDGNSVWEIQKQVEKDYKMTEELLTGISLGLGNSFTSYAMDMSSINDMILFTTQASSYDGTVRLRYGIGSGADFDGYVELQNGTAEILNSGLVSQSGYVVLGKDFLGIVEGSRDNWQNARFYDMNGRYFPASSTGGYLFAEKDGVLYLVQRDLNGATIDIWRIKFDDAGEGFCVLEEVDDLSVDFDQEQPRISTPEATVEAAAEVTPETIPTEEATAEVAAESTDEPTEAPTATTTPSYTPTLTPTPESSSTPTPTSTTESAATLIPTDTPTDVPTETPSPTNTPVPTNTPRLTNTTTATNTPTATLTSIPSPTSTPGGFLIPDFSVAGFDKITTLAGLTASFTPAANALEALFGDDYDATAYINEFIEGKCFTGEKAIGILDARSSINEQSNLRSNGTTPIVLVDGKYQVGALLFRESRPDHGLVNEELVQAAIYNILLDNVTDNPNIYSSIGITGINATINSLGGYPEGEGRLRTVAEAMQLALIYEANKDTGYRPRSNYDFQTFGATTPDENFDEYEEANSVVTQWKINVLSLLTIEQRGSLGMSLQSSNIEFIKLLLDPQKYEDLENYLFTLGSFKGDTIHAFELISMSRGNEGGTDDTTLGISPDQFADAQAKADELGATPTPTPSSTATPTSTFTSTPSYTPTNTPTLTYTPTSTPSNTPTPTSTSSNTPTNTPTLTPTLTPTPPATNTFTATPSSTPTSTGTFTPTPSPTHTPSPTSTERPTSIPTSTLPPSDTPTDLPTVTPEETIIAGQEVESRRWQAEGLFWEFDGNRLRYADGIEVWQEHWRKADNTEFLVRLGDKYYHLLPGGAIDEVNETEFELMKKEMVLVSETIDPVMLGLTGMCVTTVLLVGSLLGIGVFGRKVLKNMIRGAGDPSEEEKVIDEMLSAGVGGLTLAMSLSSMIQAYPDKTPHEILYFIKQKDPTGYTRLFENFNEQELAKIMGSLLTRTRDLLTQAGKEPSIPDELKDLVFEGGIVRRDAGAISLSFGSEFGGGKTYTISNTKDAPEYCLVIGGLVCWGLLQLNIVVDSERPKVNHADFAYNRGSFKVGDLTVENLGSLVVNEDDSLSFSGESIRVTKGDVVYSFVKDVVIEGSKVVLKKRDGSPDVELAL